MGRRRKKYNVLKDLSDITTIPYTQLTGLSDRAITCMCGDIYERMSEDNITILDIGIGSLGVMIDGDEIKYKFIPSKDFEKSIIKTVRDGENPLVDILEKAVDKYTLNAYKEML